MANEDRCQGASGPADQRWGQLLLLTCMGPTDAVRIMDGGVREWLCCELHAQALLEALPNGRVEVGSVPGAAIRVFEAVRTRALHRAARGPVRP